jgi:hypothetical protein
MELLHYQNILPNLTDQTDYYEVRDRPGYPEDGGRMLLQNVGNHL